MWPLSPLSIDNHMQNRRLKCGIEIEKEKAIFPLWETITSRNSDYFNGWGFFKKSFLELSAYHYKTGTHLFGNSIFPPRWKGTEANLINAVRKEET